jgi:hypothetical protein
MGPYERSWFFTRVRFPLSQSVPPCLFVALDWINESQFLQRLPARESDSSIFDVDVLFDTGGRVNLISKDIAEHLSHASGQRTRVNVGGEQFDISEYVMVELSLGHSFLSGAFGVIPRPLQIMEHRRAQILVSAPQMSLWRLVLDTCDGAIMLKVDSNIVSNLTVSRPSDPVAEGYSLPGLPFHGGQFDPVTLLDPSPEISVVPSRISPPPRDSQDDFGDFQTAGL